jgi:hypothetical protein
LACVRDEALGGRCRGVLTEEKAEGIWKGVSKIMIEYNLEHLESFELHAS